MKKTIGVALAGLMAMNGAANAASCASAGDMAALRTAALQQELMVAAFSCHAMQEYNSFVLSHRAELIDSDARLKAYFVHTHGSEASYHTYKTELANASSLRSIRDTDEFCEGAANDFDMTTDSSDLGTVLDSHDWRGTGSYSACSSPDLETAAATPRLLRHAARNGAARRTLGMSEPSPHHRIESDSPYDR